MANIRPEDTLTFRLTQATICPHTNRTCEPAVAMIRNLERGLLTAEQTGVVSPDFEISGSIETAACCRTCTLAFHATLKAIQINGDTADQPDGCAVVVAERAAIALQ